jgi:hypothetical protein
MNDIDISNPPSTLFSNNALYELRTSLAGGKGASSGRSNIFAIAKVGVPNLIMPSTLDIKLANYNTYSSYLQLCDNFFPKLSSSQHSILVLRPIVVKNGLNDFLV